MSVRVQYPRMREEAIDAIRSLADRGRQERYWIRKEFPSEGYFEDLSMNISILYDDTGVLREPTNRMRSVLASDEEVVALQDLAAVLDPIIDRLGDQQDAVYLQDPDWQQVIDRAGAALSVLEASTPDQRMSEPPTTSAGTYEAETSPNEAEKNPPDDD